MLVIPSIAERVLRGRVLAARAHPLRGWWCRADCLRDLQLLFVLRAGRLPLRHVTARKRASVFDNRWPALASPTNLVYWLRSRCISAANSAVSRRLASSWSVINLLLSLKPSPMALRR